MVIKPILENCFGKHMKGSDYDALTICKNLSYEFYKAGETLFKQGDIGDKFFIILKGHV